MSEHEQERELPRNEKMMVWAALIATVLMGIVFFSLGP